MGAGSKLSGSARYTGACTRAVPALKKLRTSVGATCVTVDCWGLSGPDVFAIPCAPTLQTAANVVATNILRLIVQASKRTPDLSFFPVRAKQRQCQMQMMQLAGARVATDRGQ